MAQASEWPVSGVVICCDEAPYIAGCLRSLAGCRQIVVVDSGSTDGTVAVVEALREEGLPILLLHQPWLGYAGQKQFALEQATEPWCLSLDADERLDDALRAALPTLVAARDDVDGWRLRRLPLCAAGSARPPRGLHASPILRLVRRAGAHFDESHLVHEGLVVAGRVRTAGVGRIRHERRLSFAEHLRKQLDYAKLRAAERVRRGRRPSMLKLVLDPAWYFFRLYLLHRWFLCGRTGFVWAMMGAIYAFSAESLHFDLFTS